MKLLIDGDILAYECGELKKQAVKQGEKDFLPQFCTGDILPFDYCWASVQRKIKQMMEDIPNSASNRVFLSSQDIKTWRYEIATIQEYKGGRKTDKPKYWSLIRNNLQLHYKYKMCEFIEADDGMSIEQYTDYHKLLDEGYECDSDAFKSQLNTVICSRDKDLLMVPGWHYTWEFRGQPSKLFYQTRIGGLRCFYKQLLIGDTVDNIPGLFGVGEKASCVKRLQDCNTQQELFLEVYARYKERFGNYAKQFLIENGQLLWMQTSLEDRWNPFPLANKWIEEAENVAK